jgi:hypothetical protein
MDRKAKALDFDTSTNSKEIITTLAQKLELREKSGFSIYEKVDPTTGKHIKKTKRKTNQQTQRGMLVFTLFD